MLLWLHDKSGIIMSALQPQLSWPDVLVVGVVVGVQ